MFFHKLNRLREKDVVFSMVRLLAQNDGAIEELLRFIFPYFGENCVISVIEERSREIVATTDSDDNKDFVKKVAMSLKETKKECYILSEELEGTLLRAPYSCVRVIPLKQVGVKSYFLMVEQIRNVTPKIPERCMSVLELGLRMCFYERVACQNAEIDVKTKLPNRDSLVSKLQGYVKKKGDYIGMFNFLNRKEVGLKAGIVCIDNVMAAAANIINEHFKNNCYLIAEGKIAVCLWGNPYNLCSRLQDCLDELIEYIPDAQFGCTISAMEEEIYKTMYISEKVCEKAAADTVLVIRDTGGYWDDMDESFDNVYTGKNVEINLGEDSYKEVKEEPEEDVQEEEEILEFTWESFKRMNFGGDKDAKE